MTQELAAKVRQGIIEHTQRARLELVVEQERHKQELERLEAELARLDEIERMLKADERKAKPKAKPKREKRISNGRLEDVQAVLAGGETLTQADIVQRSGYSKSSVVEAVKELKRRNLIEAVGRVERQPGQIGQASMLYRATPNGEAANGDAPVEVHPEQATLS